MSNLAKNVETGTSVREGFGETSIERRAETASSMVAAAAQAEIQARFIVAMQRPRDEDNVRIRLLKECERPNFARKAFYSVPRKGAPRGRISGIDGRIEGLSIRFAEAAIRIAGNIWQPTRTVYDDDFKRMINVAAVDLETNATYSKDIVVEKTIERSAPREGQVVLGKRKNSAGKDVYILQSSEEELLQKENSLVSRSLRTESLRLIAADTLEECERQIIETIKKADAADPDGARKEIADAFALLNVMPSDLKAYLGHQLDMCSPAQLTELRALYAAIREGEVTWPDALREKTGPIEEPAKGEGKTSAAKTVASKIAARVERQRIEKEKKTQAESAAKQAPTAERKRDREPGADDV